MSLAGSNVPDLDGKVARGRSEDVFGGRVEQDLSDLFVVAGELGDRGDIGGLLGIGEEGEVLGNLPDHDLAIVRGRSNHTIIERVPIARRVGQNRGGLWTVNTARLVCAEAKTRTGTRAIRIHDGAGKSYQSVSVTVAVWPRKRGMTSGTLPLSFTGMTAKAPPPLASQLTERYSGLA